MMTNNEVGKEDGFEDWRSGLSKPSDKGSKIDDNEIVKSEDQMPDGASNLFDDWGSDLADDNSSTPSSWARIK